MGHGETLRNAPRPEHIIRYVGKEGGEALAEAMRLAPVCRVVARHVVGVPCPAEDLGRDAVWARCDRCAESFPTVRYLAGLGRLVPRSGFEAHGTGAA